MVGDGTTTNRTGPTQVSGFTSGVSAVGLGLDHACAVTVDGGATSQVAGSTKVTLGAGTTTVKFHNVALKGAGGLKVSTMLMCDYGPDSH